jgi:phosphodiesterase/alkaline phosphatase D-like protein
MYLIHAIRFLLLFTAFPFLLIAQEDISQRSMPEDLLYPFIHGVASGAPLTHSVIIWSRLTTSDTILANVRWRVATDTLFTNVVSTGQIMPRIQKTIPLKWM